MRASASKSTACEIRRSSAIFSERMATAHAALYSRLGVANATSRSTSSKAARSPRRARTRRKSLNRVDQVGIAVERAVQMGERALAVVLRTRAPFRSALRIAIVGLEGFKKVGLGPSRVSGNTRHTTSHVRGRVAPISLDQCGEVTFRFLATTQPPPGLAQSRQDSQVVLAELDGMQKVVACRLELVQFELDEPAIDHRLGEFVIDIEREIVRITSVQETSGSGQRQPAVEVDPGEIGISGRTRREVAAASR